MLLTVCKMTSVLLHGSPARLHAACAPVTLLQQARPACIKCRADPSTSGSKTDSFYLYNSGSPTERKKATIEHVYQEKGSERQGTPAPWNMGWQMNERNLVWNDDLKGRLLKVNRDTFIAKNRNMTQFY